MIFAHLIISIVLMLLVVGQGGDVLSFYNSAMSFAHSLPWTVYAWILVVACLLILLTVILEQIKSYGLMSLLAGLIFELSLLVVSLLSFYSIFYGWKHLKNLWLDFIPLVFVPYLGVFVAMVMIQLFDFNYPYKKRVAMGFLVSGVSMALVFMHLL